MITNSGLDSQGRVVFRVPLQDAPIFEASIEMYQALKAAGISLISDEHYQEFKPVLETIKKALAKAEGRES